MDEWFLFSSYDAKLVEVSRFLTNAWSVCTQNTGVFSFQFKGYGEVRKLTFIKQHTTKQLKAEIDFIDENWTA